MLADVDVLAWYARIGLSKEARAVIEHIRASDPARRIGGGRRNVSGRYPSKKMGVTIQFESIASNSRRYTNSNTIRKCLNISTSLPPSNWITTA